MQLKGDFYLVVKRSGRAYWNLAGRLTNGVPKSLDSGEVAIKLSVSVPEAIFKAPQYKATVEIPENAVQSATIDALVLDNVKETIEQKLGMELKISLVE